MLSNKMVKKLNEQINLEFESSYLYLSISAYFESIDLKGFSHWMRTQSQEECKHAMKLYGHIINSKGTIVLPEIKRPKSKWNSIINAVEEAYNHEVHVTKMIHNIVDLATSEKDHSTFSMLQWFVTEQIEEENITNDVIKKLELINNDGTGLFLIDQELASRTNEE